MSVERGHQSIYFKDPDVLGALEALVEKDLGGQTSISSVVCEVMGKAVPEIAKQLRKGKRGDLELTFKVSL